VKHLVVLAAVAFVLTAAPQQIDVDRALQEGMSALASHDYNKAKADFEAALAAQPDHPAAHLNLGIIALIENKPADGLAHFEKIPDDSRALIGKLDCELRLRKLEDARSTVMRLEKVTAGNTGASEHIGKLLVAAGEFRDAVPFLRRVPGAGAANFLGMAAEKSGDFNQAARAFAEAVRLEPTNEDYRIDLAAVLLNSGRVEDSIITFRAAQEAFPNSSRIRLGLGSALYVAGDYKDSANAILAAVRLRPEPRAFDLLGKAYESAGDLQPRIRAEFENYLASNPSDPGAYAHFGAILSASTVDGPKARKALERALQLDPNLAAAHMQLGIMEQALGNWNEALRRYRRAAELDGQNAVVHYRLAAVYKRLEKTKEAHAEMSEFQRLKALEKNQPKVAP
jgi:tetratricopeptide (TPR) repeat protein